MTTSQIRTDLVLEAKESITELEGELRGVRVEEYQNADIEVHITKVIVESKNGAKSIGKPIGTYITIEAPQLEEVDEGYHREISNEIAIQIKSIIKDLTKEKSILIVGLGNQDVTADALGPGVVDNLHITRHIVQEYGAAAYDKEKMHSISSIVPGVMAKTGMETAEIIKGIVDQTVPDLVIVIDALAARSTKRLNRTIQITNTGIHPGSGVGNHRKAITKESLGVEVIAIGIPTVVDAATIVNDVCSDSDKDSKRMTELTNMYVTCKDIDETIKRLSFTISEAINIAFNEVK